MSEQEETNGTEEQAPVLDELTPDELGDIPNEGTDTAALEVSLLGKINWKDGDQVEVLGFVASEGAEWVQEPPKVIKNGETGEFDIKMTITDGHEMTGTIHLAGDINLYFDVNGEENAAHSSQMIGPTITSQITVGPHCVAEWIISR